MSDNNNPDEIVCELCDSPVLGSGLVDHLRNSHPNSPSSVERHYPNLYEEVVENESNEDSDAKIVGRPDEGDSDSANEEQEQWPNTESDNSDQDPDEWTTDSGTVDKIENIDDSDSEKDVESPANAQGYEKWYMLGVGGGGGNIIDAILLRRQTLIDNDDPLAAAWNGGIREVACLNTNTDSELSGTYFADEYTKGSTVDAAARYEIGPISAEGAGRDGEMGEQLMRMELMGEDHSGDPMQIEEETLMDAELANEMGPLFSEDLMEDAQGILVFHTAVKGTGSGATPLLTKWIRENCTASSTSYGRFSQGQSIFSGLILPKGETNDELLKVNGLVGMARMSNVVDAIIPFDNKRILNLEDGIGVDIEGTKPYNLDEYTEQNESIVAWLEGATLASIPQDEVGDHNIGGGDFDVKDMYVPAETMRPRGVDVNSAVIIAPSFGRVDMSSHNEFNMSALQDLMTSTIQGGKMVDFDHTTAWGASFVVLRPRKYENEIKDFSNTLEELLRGPDFMDVNEDNIPAPVAVYQVTVPGIEDAYMWGGFWNPELPRLREWYEWGEQYKDSQLGVYGRLGDNWESIEDLFRFMGRDSLEEFL